MEKYTYEGYAPHGIAVIIDVVTNNKNRTYNELQRLFSESGGTLSEEGTVRWMFEKMGVIHTRGTTTADELYDFLIPYDATDTKIDEIGDESYIVYCNMDSLDYVKELMEEVLDLETKNAAIKWVPKRSILTNQRGESLTDE